MTQENKLSESQEWTLQEIRLLRLEVAYQKIQIAKLSLDKSELAETLIQASKILFDAGKRDAAMKIKTTVKRVME